MNICGSEVYIYRICFIMLKQFEYMKYVFKILPPFFVIKRMIKYLLLQSLITTELDVESQLMSVIGM